MPKGEIFISYRRDDTGEPNRLCDALAKRFGKRAVAIDRSDIDYGSDFPDWIRNAVKKAKVVLVLIGRRWVSLEDKDGNRRLTNPGDWVAEEVGLALEHTPRVVPVLLDEAELPRADDLPERIRELVEKQLCEISPTRWAYDVGQLADSIDLFLRRGRERPPMQREAVLTVAATCLMMLLASAMQLLNIVPGRRALQNQLDGWMAGHSGNDPEIRDKVALILEDPATRVGADKVTRRANRRRDFARLVTGLSEAGAKVVVFDYYFEDATEAEADSDLAASIHGSSVPVVLGVRFFRDTTGATDETGPTPAEPLLLEELRADREGWGLIQTRPLAHAIGSPLPRIELARLKHSDAPVESGELWPSLALRAVMLTVDATRARYVREDELIRLTGETLTTPHTIPVHYVRNAEPGLMFTFNIGTSRAFEEHALDDVLHWCDNDPASLDRFAGHVVIVGSLEDQGVEAFQAVAGYRLHAAIVGHLLARRYLRTPGPLVSTIGLLAAAAFGAFWRLRSRRPRAIVEATSPYTHWALTAADLALGSVLFLVPAAVLALVVFKQGKLVVPIFYWLAALVVAYLALSVLERRQET